MEEIESLLEDEPEVSAYFAVCELERGRLEWLGEHIKRCNFHISPLVARKLLTLLEPTDEGEQFELSIRRRRNLASAKKDEWEERIQNFEMAVEVASRGGFERAQSARVCHDVGIKYGLSGGYVLKRVRPFREDALRQVRETNTSE